MSQKSVTRHIFQKQHLARLYCKIFSRIQASCKMWDFYILQNFLQDNSDLARFLARNKNLASFACKIFTIFLQDMQENGHFAWTSCKISKKYRNIRPRLWDLACMIIARIVDVRARWFDLGSYQVPRLQVDNDCFHHKLPKFPWFLDYIHLLILIKNSWFPIFKLAFVQVP